MCVSLWSHNGQNIHRCTCVYIHIQISIYKKKILLSTKKIEFSVSIMKMKEKGTSRECKMVLADHVCCVLPAEESQVTFV